MQSIHIWLPFSFRPPSRSSFTNYLPDRFDGVFHSLNNNLFMIFFLILHDFYFWHLFLALSLLLSFSFFQISFVINDHKAIQFFSKIEKKTRKIRQNELCKCTKKQFFQFLLLSANSVLVCCCCCCCCCRCYFTRLLAFFYDHSI